MAPVMAPEWPLNGACESQRMETHVMTKSFMFCIALTALCAGSSSNGAPATAQSASSGLTSTRTSGVVSIQADPVLSSGRLVLKVAAHNPTDKAAELSSSAVNIFIADKPVALLTVDQLIDEARGGPPAERSANSAHQSSNYSRPTTSTSRSGELDVNGVTGASGRVGSVPERSSSRSGSRSAPTSDPVVEARVEALKAGILQTLAIPPGKAAGAQVVTEKLKFSRRDPRVVRAIVVFNGESHEFEFEAPPAK
jgi:hypothetical protein